MPWQYKPDEFYTINISQFIKGSTEEEIRVRLICQVHSADLKDLVFRNFEFVFSEYEDAEDWLENLLQMLREGRPD